MNLLLTLLSIAYAATGVIGTIGYWPTISDLWHRKDSANFDSYIIWTLCSVIAFAYSIFILNDWLVRTVVGMNVLACVVILVLTVRLERKIRKKGKRK